MLKSLSESEISKSVFNDEREKKRSKSSGSIIDQENQYNFHESHNNQSTLDTKTSLKDSHKCIETEVKNVVFIPNIFISVILSNQTTFLMGFPITQTIEDLYKKLAQYFDIPETSFKLLFEEDLNITHKKMKFQDLNLSPGVTIETIINDKKMDIVKNLQMINRAKNDPMVVTNKSIFVHMKNTDTNRIKSIQVDIERIHFTKHFLGGFRHKSTGIEYHHAIAQTRSVPKSVPKWEMFSRETQTYRIKNIGLSNFTDSATQMTKTAYYVSNVTDRVVTPRGYQTADELHQIIVSKVIIIQKNFRRWLARKRVKKLRQIKNVILQHQLAAQKQKAEEMAARLQILFDKQRCPLYNDDFDLLYNAIEKWRLRQIDKIDPQLPESERNALHCRIQDEQHEWILAVERLKINAIKLLNFRAKKNKLVKVSKPLIWKDRTGQTIEMDLMSTTRGKEVFEIYKSLSMDFFNVEERLDILLTLKRLITNRSEKICVDLLSLINREADLIMRNVSMSLLKGLRLRINTTFLILCRMPSFNPGVEKYSQVPPDPLDMRGNFQLCRYCNNYLKNSQFMFSVKSNRLGACRSCARLYNHAMPRQDLSRYRHILSCLQKAEEAYQDNSKMAFIFSEIDIKQLITKIWGSKSVLSSNADLENLTFVRWLQSSEWSPWNTALMTHDEAEAHYKMKDPCAGYCEKLLNKIQHNQIVGHNYFSQLKELSSKFTVHNLQEEQGRIHDLLKVERDRFSELRKNRFN